MKNKYWSVFLHLKSGWQRSDSSPSFIFFKISYSSGKSCTAPVNPAVPSTPFSRGSHGSKLAGYSDTLHLYKKACEVPAPASYLWSCSRSRSSANLVSLHLYKKACEVPDPAPYLLASSSSRSAASFVSPDANLQIPASKDQSPSISTSFSSGQRISEDSYVKISGSLLPLQWKRLLPSSGPGHPFSDGLWPPAWSRPLFLPPSTPYFSLPFLEDNSIGPLYHNLLHSRPPAVLLSNAASSSSPGVQQQPGTPESCGHHPGKQERLLTI